MTMVIRVLRMRFECACFPMLFTIRIYRVACLRRRLWASALGTRFGEVEMLSMVSLGSTETRAFSADTAKSSADNSGKCGHEPTTTKAWYLF